MIFLRPRSVNLGDLIQREQRRGKILIIYRAGSRLFITTDTDLITLVVTRLTGKISHGLTTVLGSIFSIVNTDLSFLQEDGINIHHLSVWGYEKYPVLRSVQHIINILVQKIIYLRKHNNKQHQGNKTWSGIYGDAMILRFL